MGIVVFIIGVLLSLLIGSLIVTLVLMPIVRMVCLYKPKFLNLYPQTLFGLAVSGIALAITTVIFVRVVSWFAPSVFSNDTTLTGLILALPGETVRILVFSFFIGLIEKPDGDSIGYKKGLIISLILKVLDFFIRMLFTLIMVTN